MDSDKIATRVLDCGGGSNRAKMLNYKYAELCKGKKWFVNYAAIDPSTGTLKRKRIYLNHIHDAKLRERYARKLCTKINDKLDQGWNPFISEKNNNQYTDIKKAFDFLLLYKSRSLSDRGLATYKSRIGIFFDYLKANKLDKIFVFEFTDRNAIEFFNYLLLDRNVAGRTYNNYLLDFRTFFNFFIKHRYVIENPFLVIDEMPEVEKEKQPFTIEESQLYSDYCAEHDPNFLVISGLCYYCALRPVEITRLKVSFIDKEQRQIKMPGSQTKNKKNGVIPVPNVFWPLLEAFIKDKPGSYFVCSKEFKPGVTSVQPTRIADRFRLIAREIGLPEYVKFYSLKDTAAERLDQNNVGLRTIRDLFRHSNIAVTDAYMRGFRNRELEGLRESFPPLNS